MVATGRGFPPGKALHFFSVRQTLSVFNSFVLMLFRYVPKDSGGDPKSLLRVERPVCGRCLADS
jgi:hypothetical protein